MGFTSLGLSAPILKAIQEKGYDTPSPIQAKAIPAILEGKDVMAAAQTGTGKTAGFTLPILERLSNGPRVRANQVRALILTPTRELAAQVQENVFMYGRHLPLSSAVVFGGVKINPQMLRLRKGADVLVATPGRLMDLYNQNAVKFDQLEVLVLDEADRMLDMGFIRDIRKILALLPKQRQNLLFSATFSDEIRDLAKGLVNNPVEISVNPANSTARTVEQSIYPADVKKKAPMLVKLIKDGDWKQVLVFTKTKHGANRLAKFLIEQNLPAAAIHGNKSQGARTKALADFKSGEIRVLVATDIAARGIDIPQLPQVVNFELPKVAEDYVHRIGRTGRAGEVGKAISLVCALEASELFAIERLIKEVLPRKELEGFAPTNVVPESKLDTRPIKPKKTKKPKKPKTPNAASENAPATEKKTGNGANKPKRRFNGGNNGNKNSTNQGGAGKPKGNREGQGRANSKPDDRKPNSTKPNGNKPNGNKPNGNKSGNAGKPSGNRKPNNAKPAGNKPSGQRRKPRPQATN
ncbi:DEAD/DEAH box helicase [Vibrio parahaemolyticus]|nr:DEAD/DEAH box helicase [Vibrio parahaemolyticus]EIE1272943.1 DEAD/DEAH box helicase [Vibrio parahaemolyticus]ELA8110765.1 DEAD/DEAH box helicase [Vibrio parahaemolyticus]ELA8164498.1 DEAD/DEAH box helicase [Vibrio parahaemolyticus]HCG6375077.1 DEAD/DEAH box helicase [Vibrio parahaemolyticus]